ncbi:SpoIIE family protein phosphatase [Umezawaea sp. NPDC059074]|uniref:SpoIIE family protein phosphatase n=1 Tax=Umezawaea sp. NPDC059074 TaxID=3346716 RepID=UPI0036C42FB0
MEDLDAGGLSHLVATVGADGSFAELNAAGRAILGIGPAADVTSTRFDRFVADEALIAVLAAPDRAWSGDTSLRVDGVDVEVFLVCTTSSEPPGGLTVVARVLAGQGVDERFLADLEREWQSVEDAEQVMALATRLLGEHLGVDRCAYARTEADEDHFVMSGDHATGLPHLTGRFAMSQFGEGCLRAMRAGGAWVVDDSRVDDRLRDDDPAAYQATGIRAVICQPLMRKGRFVAAMAVHQATARRWTPAEIALVAAVVDRCGESLERANVARALRDSEQRYRLLVERATDGIWVLDEKLRFVEVNPAACALLGYDRADLLGTSVTDLFVSGYESTVAELSATTREANEVWEVRRADGTVLALELSVQGTPTGVQAIARDVTARQREETERELLRQHEHEIAETLQRSLLPRRLPELPRLAASARYLPASALAQTGGDWYEVLQISDTTVALSVGDVVGKGPTAAAVMGQLRTALAISLLDGHSPAAALERLDAFALRVNGAAGSTCACLTFDWSTGLLRWAVAGHPPPVLVNAGAARFLDEGGGPVLGVRGRDAYREEMAVLAPGASVVLYTDGLVERRDAPIDTGLERLLDAVRAGGGLAPDALAHEVTDALLADGHDDDVALLAVRYLPESLVRRGVPAESVQLGVMRRAVEEWASGTGLSPDALDDLQLALGEAAANAVDHAYPHDPGDFDYEVTRTAEGRIDVVVRDRGRWRPEPTDNGNRGRGVRIIEALSERAVFDRGPTGTTLRFRLAADTVGLPVASHPGPAPDDSAGALAVRLTGDLDLARVREVRAELLARISAAARLRVEVDLTRLRYLSSSGIALLLDLAAETTRTGGRLTVTAARGSAPARILELSGLDGISTGSNLVVATAPVEP